MMIRMRTEQGQPDFVLDPRSEIIGCLGSILGGSERAPAREKPIPHGCLREESSDGRLDHWSCPKRNSYAKSCDIEFREKLDVAPGAVRRERQRSRGGRGEKKVS